MTPSTYCALREEAQLIGSDALEPGVLGPCSPRGLTLRLHSHKPRLQFAEGGPVTAEMKERSEQVTHTERNKEQYMSRGSIM